jgi:hypothetical protein
VIWLAVAPDLFVATTASAGGADGFRSLMGKFHMRSLRVLRRRGAAQTNCFLLLASYETCLL